MISDQQSPAFEKPTLQVEGFQDVFNLWTIDSICLGFRSLGNAWEAVAWII